ncbi:MAG: THUMP domain-containing protein, partial [Candidatus Methanospirareceae archaeon]
MIVVKTERGMEYVAANLIRERCKAEIEVRPGGYMGLLLVYHDDPEEIRDIPEIDRIIPVRVTCKSDVEEIVGRAEELVKGENFNSFAVRTKRRGKHPFTSVD